MAGQSNMLAIFDLEFTSWEGSLQREWSGKNEHREIVEIGVVKLDLLNWRVTGEEYRRLVKPRVNPQLSEYFTNLTQISQKEVTIKESLCKEC